MPRHKKATDLAMSDAEILEVALIGLEHQRSAIEEKMAELRQRLDGRAGRPAQKSVAVDSAEPTPKKRTMSAAGRRRIAAAQRNRWAELKEGTAEKPQPAKKKCGMSAAGRARIIAATKKRWAEFRKKKVPLRKRGSPMRTSKQRVEQGIYHRHPVLMPDILSSACISTVISPLPELFLSSHPAPKILS